MPDNTSLFFKSILGLDKEKGYQPSTITQIIGGALMGGGLIGAINASNNQKSYLKETESISSRMGEVASSLGVEADKAGKELTADLSGYQDRAITSAQEGLRARGITDIGVSAETAGTIKSGLSGAYAAAHAALAGAKLRAQSSVDASLTNYKMHAANLQYQSLLSQYAGKMGIWGSLGGLGASIASLPGGKSPIQPTTPTVEDIGTIRGTDERGGK